jgi:hypothetical protein
MSPLVHRSDEQEVRIGVNTPVRIKKLLRFVAAAAVLLICILIFTLVTSRTDYISYWSAGKLLIHHADPYSPSGVAALQNSEGYFHMQPLIMRNPPWALFLAAPLGLGGIRIGLFFWTLATAGCVFLSAQLLRAPSRDRAFAYVFAPAVAAIFMGQSSAFLLLGFSLFLRFHRSHPFLAGASLLLMLIKPHLFLAFWVVLLADCIYRRSILVFAGGVSALAAASAFSICFEPHIWQHYLAMLRTSSLQSEAFPTFSTLFRVLVDVHAFWLIFVPSALTILWGLWYYVSRRRSWDWRIHGMLLILLSILFAPYSWFTDEVVLLPSILFALSYPQKRRYSNWILLLINTIALWIVLARQSPLESHAYLWTPLAWLAWFLYATHPPRGQRDIAAPPPVPKTSNAQKAPFAAAAEPSHLEKKQGFVTRKCI